MALHFGILSYVNLFWFYFAELVLFNFEMLYWLFNFSFAMKWETFCSFSICIVVEHFAHVLTLLLIL